MVGAHVVVAPPRRLDRQPGQHGQPSGRGLAEVFELALPAAEDHPRALAVEVEPRREVHGERGRAGDAAVAAGVVHRAGLAAYRKLDPDAAREPGRVHPGGADDGGGRDRPFGGVDAGDPAVLGADGGDRAPGLDADAEPPRRRRVALHHRLRRRVPLARAERGADEVVRGQLRDELAHRRHVHHLARDAEALLDAYRPAEGVEVGGRAEHEQVAHLLEADRYAGELLEAQELRQRAAYEQGVELVGVLQPDSSRGLAGRARAQRVRLQQDDVRAPGRGQMVGDAGSDAAATDDHDLGSPHPALLIGSEKA